MYTAKKVSKYLQIFRSTPHVYVVYILYVPEYGVLKVGRSSRHIFRLRNVKAGLWTSHEVHLIRCADAQEMKKVDRHLVRSLQQHWISGEWYKSTLDNVKEILECSEFQHLVLESYQHNTKPIVPPLLRGVQLPTSFNVELS